MTYMMKKFYVVKKIKEKARNKHTNKTTYLRGPKIIAEQLMLTFHHSSPLSGVWVGFFCDTCHDRWLALILSSEHISHPIEEEEKIF